jgi:hypothetical protein
MRHTALWSCTHIPNIIDLSGKTKKGYGPDKVMVQTSLWSRQGYGPDKVMVQTSFAEKKQNKKQKKKSN